MTGSMRLINGDTIFLREDNCAFHSAPDLQALKRIVDSEYLASLASRSPIEQNILFLRTYQQSLNKFISAVAKLEQEKQKQAKQEEKPKEKSDGSK